MSAEPSPFAALLAEVGKICSIVSVLNAGHAVFDWARKIQASLGEIARLADAGWAASVECETVRQSAGDLLCAAIDRWVAHAPWACDVDPCDDCGVTFNQVRLAWKVWKSSAHQKVSPALQAELLALVRDLQAHAREHGWQDCDAPIANLLAIDLEPAP